VVEVETLSDDECWALLTGAVIGRLVFADGDELEVFPVNFMVHDRTILFRTAPGSKLEAIGSRPNVAFEVDEHGPIWVWSVIVRGRAERMSRDDEIESSGVLDLESWSPDEKYNYVRITPTRLSGRRFPLPRA
jgi:nitroimidazol reductase NimA-like FMN-containing flavoprotein (pyridoxamine 5'-phosphate oxidase superfamily)